MLLQVESFDGRDLLCNYGNSLRPAVAKSYSFGGYTAGCASAGELALIRGQSTPGNGAYPHHILNQNPGYINPRFLSKQVGCKRNEMTDRVEQTKIYLYMYIYEHRILVQVQSASPVPALQVLDTSRSNHNRSQQRLPLLL